MSLPQRREGGDPGVLKLSLPSQSRKGSDPTPLAGSPELTQEAVLDLGGEEGKEGGLEARAVRQQLGFDMALHGVEGAKCSRGVPFSPPPFSLPIWASPLLKKSWLNTPFLQEAFPG